MSSIEWLAAATVLGGFCLAAWAWLAMAQATEELRNFAGFEGMHFEETPFS